MIDFSYLIDNLEQSKKLSRLAKCIPEYIRKNLSTKRYGDLQTWYDALESLPNIEDCLLETAGVVKISSTQIIQEQKEIVERATRVLIPWRKGPFQIFDTFIDSEWRSDWKWQRLLPHVNSLKNRTVLDVGCGNGYHCFRIYGEGAKQVLGIEPSPRFIMQFHMLKHFVPHIAVDLIPAGIEELPENLERFDTTFSMGVLYHRRSPIDHITQLYGSLRDGGELVLETLIVDGDENTVLVPKNRYSMMNNVWFIPSAKALCLWLEKCGFNSVRCVDINTTSLNEQRKTDWMNFFSLEDFLDKKNPALTVEGYPAPKRGIFIANKS